MRAENTMTRMAAVLALFAFTVGVVATNCYKNLGPVICATQGATCGNRADNTKIPCRLCDKWNPGSVLQTTYRDISDSAGSGESGYTNPGTPIPCGYTCHSTCPDCAGASTDIELTGANSQMPWGDCCTGGE
jgi:hypothetical protein